MVPAEKKPRKWLGKHFSAAEGALAFSVLLFGSFPSALVVMGDLDKEESRDGRSGNDLGTGHTECDGGIDERPRREVFLTSLSPLYLWQDRSHA
jgi:hypothetical protein